jgi:AcrR family transcriptional regulator
MPTDSDRREQILATAASLLASSGIRTSLKEIGDACGILPGSLYHHFESKDALIIELVQRYRDELEQVSADALTAVSDADLGIEDRVTAFGEAIAACAVRNRAALLLTLYDPPKTASDELVRLAHQSPVAAISAMTEILEVGQKSGEIRSSIDVSLLSERICQSMLHVGVGAFHRSQAAKRLPTMKCRVLLHGLAPHAPADPELERSAARRVADDVIAGWTDTDDDDRASQLRAAGRLEFGRRGYEATTTRDIAKAAGLTTGTVYRTYRSKDELLVAIMERYSDTFSGAWDAVLESSSSIVEKVDALLWVNINLLERFGEEFKIQLAWLRQLPPDSVELGLSFGKTVRQLQVLMAEGERDGDLCVVSGGAVATRARSTYELLLTPASIITRVGPRASLDLARQSVLRGAMARS